jgi:hypothetical protein
MDRKLIIKCAAFGVIGTALLLAFVKIACGF